MCQPLPPRDICMALTPWKQLRIALSTEPRARLSPTTAGIYRRQETPGQPLESWEIHGHWHQNVWSVVRTATGPQELRAWGGLRCLNASKWECIGFVQCMNRDNRCVSRKMWSWEEKRGWGEGLAIGAMQGRLSLLLTISVKLFNPFFALVCLCIIYNDTVCKFRVALR